MKDRMAPLSIAAALLTLLAGAAAADTITVRGREQAGRFEGYEDNQFLFRTAEGALITHPRTAVQKLALDTPCDVVVVRAAKSAPEAGKLLGYESAKFSLQVQGAARDIPGMTVRSLAVQLSPEDARGGGGDEPRARAALDVADLEGRELTAAQTAALRRYKAARARYVAFVAKSSAMVSEMDRATGAKRENVLNALRLRKTEEQPVARELEQAERALRTALQGADLGAGAPPAAGGEAPAARPGDGHAAGGVKTPQLGSDQVLLLDVGSMESLPNLTAAQTTALRGYKAAKDRYTAATAGTDEEAAATKALAAAQATLFAAFPGLRLTN